MANKILRKCKPSKIVHCKAVQDACEIADINIMVPRLENATIKGSF